jgi:hypothetical protein
MKKLILLGMLVLMLGFCSSQVFAQFHGATIAKNTESPKAPGETLNSQIQVGYNDDFGDTIEILECWDVVDIGGDNVRVPATGDLEIIAVSGNTTATVGGSLPVLIGASGSTLNGLPGLAGDGEVTFVQNTYVVQLDDPNPLPDQANANVRDLCDDPETEGCSSIINLLQFTASTDIECPEPCIDITKSVDPTTSKVGDEVIYEICVTNCGEFPLIDVQVTDSHLGPIDFPPSLEPGQEVCVEIPYVIQEEDAPGPRCNVAAVTAIDGCDEETQVGDESEEVCVELVNPAICIDKTVDNETPCIGDTVIYTICIENCGDHPLENIEVTDPHLGGVLEGFPDQLAPGESACVDIEYVVEPDDECPTINTATVTSTAVDLGNPREASDDAEICPQPCGEEGCTPGFWKNNADKKEASAWDCFTPETLFSDVFGEVITINLGKKQETVDDPTLLEALKAQGGGINALARHATAALLNACSDCVQYPMTVDEIIAEVQDAIPDGDIQGLKNQLAEYNEAGCPVNQQGECVGVEEE